MKELFELVGAIMLSIGGASLILFALSSWLGKVWATHILEKERVSFQKEIELYKSKLEIELSKVHSHNENAIHVTKVQYDKEFEIYIDIWDKLNDCVTKTLLLSVDVINILPDHKATVIQNAFFSFTESHKNFRESIEKNMPFYEHNFYSDFKQIEKDCLLLSSFFAHADQERITSLSEKITSDKHILANNINIYLKSLKII